MICNVFFFMNKDYHYHYHVWYRIPKNYRIFLQSNLNILERSDRESGNIYSLGILSFQPVSSWIRNVDWFDKTLQIHNLSQVHKVPCNLVITSKLALSRSFIGFMFPHTLPKSCADRNWWLQLRCSEIIPRAANLIYQPRPSAIMFMRTTYKVILRDDLCFFTSHS